MVCVHVWHWSGCNLFICWWWGLSVTLKAASQLRPFHEKGIQAEFAELNLSLTLQSRQARDQYTGVASQLNINLRTPPFCYVSGCF